MPARKAATKKRVAKRTPKRPAKRSAARPDLDLPSGWDLDKGGRSMSRAITTKDFLQAVEIVSAIAPVAEELEHHPDLHLERWNHLRICTWSHDAGGLTERDVRLAKRIDQELRARGWL